MRVHASRSPVRRRIFVAWKQLFRTKVPSVPFSLRGLSGNARIPSKEHRPRIILPKRCPNKSFFGRTEFELKKGSTAKREGHRQGARQRLANLKKWSMAKPRRHARPGEGVWLNSKSGLWQSVLNLRNLTCFVWLNSKSGLWQSGLDVAPPFRLVWLNSKSGLWQSVGGVFLLGYQCG